MRSAPIGIQCEFGAEQAGGRALELEHVKQIPVVGHMAAEPVR